MVEDVDDRLADVKLPVGYHLQVLGESTELKAAQNRLALFGLLAAASILLLHAALGSFRLALLTFLLLPMALVGGVLAVWLGGDSVLSLGSLVGFLTVFGIAARTGS